MAGGLLPMLLVEGFLQLVTSADVVMVSFWQSPDEVAVYFAASKTLALVHFIYFAVRAASAHRFAALHVASHDAAGRAAFEAYVRRAGFWTFWPSVAAAAVLIAAAPFLLALFGPGFEAGTALIAVLLVGVLARASAGPADVLLTMCGLQKACAAIYSGVFILNVGLNLLLIPPFGLMGAAVATSLPSPARHWRSSSLPAAALGCCPCALRLCAGAGPGGAAWLRQRHHWKACCFR
ncbi:hypothetical protein V6L77_10385 [Pannonibacter sp. Pt2-lr]